MFLPFPRVRGAWVALVLVALTPLSAIAVSPVKKFPKCCVWRVINAEAPFYLVGSIHALDKNDYPLPSPYEVALRNSTRFVFEFDPNRAPEFERKFEAAAKYPLGQDIRSKIDPADIWRSEEHTSELQSRFDLVCRLLLEKKKKNID